MLNTLSKKFIVTQKNTFSIYQFVSPQEDNLEKTQIAFLKKIDPTMNEAVILNHASFHCGPNETTLISDKSSSWTCVRVRESTQNAWLRFNDTSKLLVLEKDRLIFYPSALKSYIVTDASSIIVDVNYIIKLLPLGAHELS